MSATVEDVIDAVVADMQAYPFGEAVEIQATYRTRTVLQDIAKLTAPRLSIILQDLGERFVCRGMRAKAVTLDIVLQRKIAKTGLSVESSGMVGQMEGLLAHFREKQYPGVGTCRSATPAPVFSSAHMDSFSTFTGVLTIVVEVQMRGRKSA